MMNNSGTELMHVANPAPSTHSFGHAMSATGDLGGDKGLDILIGAPDEVSGSGAAYLVTIRANKPPVANAGPDQLIECDRSRTVTLDGSKSYDPDKDAIAYTWKQVSGTTVELIASGSDASFAAAPPGVYEFQLTVTDDKGGSSTDNVVITIKDTRPPVITVNFSPSSLWPPNHKMVDVSAFINVVDACDPNPTVKLVSIVSNEPANSTGDGNTSPDIAGASYGTDDRSFQVRAERKGNGNGRIYTGTYAGQDASGNSKNGSGTVMVVHSQADVSTTKMVFPEMQVGSSGSAQTVTISNASPDPLTISSFVIGGADAGDFSVTENCIPSVSADSSCSANVVFKPADSGNRTASLLVSGNASNLPALIALTGSGIAVTADYEVSPSATSAVVKQGQSANFSLTITPKGGFNHAVSFACSGLPANATCSFSPASVTPNGSPIATKLTVTTMAPSRSALAESKSNWLTRGGTLAVIILLVPGIFRRKSRGSVFTNLTLLLMATGFLVACGGGGAKTSTVSTMIGGTPLGTTPFTVSASGPSGTSQHNINLSITVTQ
jgi:hypothetical protein